VQFRYVPEQQDRQEHVEDGGHEIDGAPAGQAGHEAADGAGDDDSGEDAGDDGATMRPRFLSSARSPASGVSS
jgi:hypothetical protein